MDESNAKNTPWKGVLCLGNLGESGVVELLVVTDQPGGATHLNVVTIIDLVHMIVNLVGSNDSGQGSQEGFILTRSIHISTKLPPPLNVALHDGHGKVGLAIVLAVHAQDNIEVGGDVVVVTIGGVALRGGVLGVNLDGVHFFLLGLFVAVDTHFIGDVWCGQMWG